MAHVLVIGASKGIGLETVKAALDAGHRVRAFARSATGMTLWGAGLERFSGDALNAGDVASALHGVDAVVQALRDRGVQASTSSLSRFFARHGITRKKGLSTRPSRSGRM